MKRQPISTNDDGIKVYCGYTRLADPNTLKRHPKAFTDHSRAQRALIGEIIEGNGWREPVTTSKKTGHVTRGWARVLAAIDKGWTAIPIDEQIYKDQAAELGDAVADTKIQEFSKLDTDKLKAIVVRLQEKSFDLRLTGLEQSVIDGILADYERRMQMNINPTTDGGGTGIRQVILVYDDDRFKQFSEAVAKLGEKRPFDSLSELCLSLLRERNGNETDNARTESATATGLREAGRSGNGRKAKDHGAV